MATCRAALLRQQAFTAVPQRCCPSASRFLSRRQRRHAAVSTVQATADHGQGDLETTMVIPTGRVCCARDPTQPPCWIPPLIVVGLATLFSAVILQNRKRKPAVRETDEVMLIPPSPQQDPRSYQRALARTRQAAHVTKALAFLKAGEPARAYMELGRALSENSICRSPLLDGHHSKDELVELYKLHLKNTEVPPNFATLLQLQEMLGLNQEEADKIELDIMQSPGAFMI